jgi:hypothetical protein
MATKKRTTGQTMIYNTPHIKLNIEQDKPIKTGGEVRCSGRVGISGSTYVIRRYEIYIILITGFKLIKLVDLFWSQPWSIFRGSTVVT